MEKDALVLVTGAAGMGGSAVMLELIRQGFTGVMPIDKDVCDLTDTNQVNTLFSLLKPDYIFHLAAKVGGINANNTQSADFTYQNLMMECNVLQAAKLFKVKKLIFCGSACIYPKDTKMPIKEEYFLSGKLEETNKGYAIAKIAGVILCQMYRKQYGCDFISAMPTNLYGPRDNFHLTDSHVLPALLRKFHDAKIQNSPSVEIWGTGNTWREFLYVEDLAKALIFLMENYSEAEPINVGTGTDLRIQDLVKIISTVVDYQGEVKWNTTYPDGVYERRLDVSRINELGWKAEVDVATGIKKTYDWMVEKWNDIRK